MVSRLPGEDPFSSDAGAESLLYQEIKHRVSQQDFEIWFEQSPCTFYPPDRIVFKAANKFRRAWMEKNFRELVRSSARSVFSLDARVEFVVDERAGSAAGAQAPSQISSRIYPPQRSEPGPGAGGLGEPRSDPLETEPQAARAEPQTSLIEPRPSPGEPKPSQSVQRPPGTTRPAEPFAQPELDPDLTLETFVVGPSNRVARAAAAAVADAPGKAYNPLFVHGEPGVGKTHLLHAICHRIVAVKHLRITCLTAEQFLGRFTSSVIDSTLECFRRFCRETDVLVLEDLQFLSAKPKTQTELFHVFNSFMEEEKQILLSSRVHPRDLPGIKQRLASRFQWGLVVSLEPPTFDSRVEILLRKARRLRKDLPVEVAQFIASNVTHNVRELEGALLNVVNMADFRKSGPDMEAARMALSDTLNHSQGQGAVTVADILQSIQDYYHIKPKDLLARSKVRSLVLPRQIGMYLARQLTRLSLEEIGAYFGGRDHTTVLYAEDRVSKLRQQNVSVRSQIEILTHRLSSWRA